VSGVFPVHKPFVTLQERCGGASGGSWSRATAKRALKGDREAIGLTIFLVSKDPFFSHCTSASVSLSAKINKSSIVVFRTWAIL
jgi:hypothetical protein